MSESKADDDTPRALQGLRVLEFGEFVGASYCTKLLADLGAEVFKVEEPQGDPLRRTEPIDHSGPEPTGGLFHYLNANKRGVVVDLDDPGSVAVVHELACGADVLVENYGPGKMEGFGLGPEVLRAQNPPLAYVRLSNYGQTGPWHDRVSSSIVFQAETAMSTRLGDGGGVPASIVGHLDQYVGGIFAASGALAAATRAERTGEGSVVDVSLYETLLYTLSPVDLVLEFMAQHGVEAPARQRVSPGFVPCADGTVCISVLTAQNWIDLCLVTGLVEWVDRMQETQNDGPARTEFLEGLSAWSRPLDAAQVIETMHACRVAASDPTDGQSMLDHPVFRTRDFFVPHPGASFVRPAAPYRLSETPVRNRTAAPNLSERADVPSWSPRDDGAVDVRVQGDRDALPLAGLRVVDLTMFLAGGHVGESLASLGARVVKVESPWRPDGYRLVGTFPGAGDEWWELSPLWQAQSFNKVGLGIDLSRDEGRDVLERLIATSDVLLENFTPRVMENFGFDYERVRAINPAMVMVRMPAFGLEGPWREHTGFAYNIEQVSGMAQNGWADGPLVQPAGIVDIVNGQHALVATLAALRHRERTRQGQLVEICQVESAACITADQVIEYQLTGRCRERAGNRERHWVPQGFYPCRDDRWIAISARTDAQWRSLCDLINAPTSLRDLPLEQRWELHDELDASIEAWTHDRSAQEIAKQLQALDVAAGILTLPAELPTNSQLVDRGYYLWTSHPGEGDRRRSRLPVLFSFGDLPNGPAPRLGQHNVDVLEDLGLDPDHIDRLQRDSVVAAGLQA